MKNNLKEIRTNAGLTQEQLAAMIGTSKAYISQLENGVRNIDTIRQGTMDKRCAALGCDPKDLVVSVEFQYNEDGRLIIDSAWHDPHFPAGYVLLIDGNAFHLPLAKHYTDGRSAVNDLRPLKFYTKPKHGDKAQKIETYEYALIPCAPKDGIDVKIGRAISKEELEKIREEYNITDDDISDRFVSVKGGAYGKKYTKTYGCVQVRVRSSKAIELERRLTDDGIEAGNIAPSRVNIRVD